MSIGIDELQKRFTYHEPKDRQVERYHDLRNEGLQFAKLIDQYVPDSREKAVALTKLEEAVMWANAGIARNE